MTSTQFFAVSAIAGQIPEVTVNKQLTSSQTTTFKLSVPLVTQSLGTGGSIQQFICYAPTEFEILSNQAVYFNVNPGQPQALTADDPNLFVLPTCQILEMWLTDNGTSITGTAGLMLGTVAIAPPPGTPSLATFPPTLTSFAAPPDSQSGCLMQYALTTGAALSGAGLRLGGGCLNGIPSTASTYVPLLGMPLSAIGPMMIGFGLNVGIQQPPCPQTLGGVNNLSSSRVESPSYLAILESSMGLATGDMAIRITAFVPAT